MTSRWHPDDEPFYREWNARRPGERRSLARAALFAELLGLDLHRLPPVLTVVGSKGKGTAVTYASAALFASGHRVGSVISPPFVTNAERIRVDGRALDVDTEYHALADRARAALAALPAGDGAYLSPTGAYTIAGVAHLVTSGVDALVVEEGLGGASDEVSLIAPDVVAVTPIFEEHTGLLGGTVEAIAADLLGVVRGTTRVVVAAPQRPAVAALVEERAAHAELQWGSYRSAEHATAHVPGLGAANAALGLTAAARFAALAGWNVPAADAAAAARRVRLPGRLSVHPPMGGRRGTWVVDAAISPDGVAAALDWCRRALGEPVAVLASFPAIKDAAGCFAALSGARVVAVSAGESYLHFDEQPGLGAVTPSADAFAAADRKAGAVLCVGTISFVAEALDHVGADTTRMW